MARSLEIAESVAERLEGDGPGLAGRVRARAVDGQAKVEVAGEPDGAMLELRPPVEAREVPVWAPLCDGIADLTEIDFEPASVSLVRWGEAHAQRGLVVDFPQMLLSSAIAGRTHDVPIAGGRRGDGRLELWIEPMPSGVALAAVEAAVDLGQIAEPAWRTRSGTGRCWWPAPRSREPAARAGPSGCSASTFSCTRVS